MCTNIIDALLFTVLMRFRVNSSWVLYGTHKNNDTICKLSEMLIFVAGIWKIKSLFKKTVLKKKRVLLSYSLNFAVPRSNVFPQKDLVYLPQFYIKLLKCIQNISRLEKSPLDRLILEYYI